MELEALTDRVIGCAIEVHRTIGPGLLESAYSLCLAHELAGVGVSFEREKTVSVACKGIHIDCGFRLDMLVEGSLILELKPIDKFCPFTVRSC